MKKKSKKKVSKSTQPKAKAKGLRILVANGVNLDLLGTREPSIYGVETLADLEKSLRAAAPAVASAAGAPTCVLTFFQSNDETTFLAQLDKGYDGAIINPGAWTHTSLALADRLKGLALPYVEAHISNVAGREDFRQRSFTAPGAVGIVHGFGLTSYRVALYGLLCKLVAKE